MSNPREILRQIRQRQVTDQPTANALRTPAPTPISPAPVQPVARRQTASPIQPVSAAPVQPVAPAQRQPPAQPVPRAGHALYSELMRSHDRMGTRHLKP